MSKVVLQNARILRPDLGRIVEPQNIVIEDGLIHSIDSVEQPLIDEPDTDIYDVMNRVVVAGLIDAHVHVTSCTTNLADLARMPASLVTAQATVTLREMLMRGFTTVRDAGGADRGLADAVAQGYLEGPKLFVSGLGLAQTGGQGDFRSSTDVELGCPRCHSLRTITRVVDGVDQVRHAARDELRKGAAQLKVMAGGGVAGGIPIGRSHFSPAELGAVVDEAASFGTYVMAHAYAPDSIQRAVAAGVRTIEHGNLIDARTADLIAAKAYVVPTLAVYDGYLEHSKDLGLTADTRDAVEALLDAGLRSLDICRRAGVKIGFGTDLEGMLHGGQLRELTLRAQVMTSAEVIASATITNAEILRAEDKLGVLKAGSSADLLVVNGDPFEDISVLADDTSESVSVMQAGRFVRNPLQPTESHREGAQR